MVGYSITSMESLVGLSVAVLIITVLIMTVLIITVIHDFYFIPIRLVNPRTTFSFSHSRTDSSPV